MNINIASLKVYTSENLRTVVRVETTKCIITALHNSAIKLCLNYKTLVEWLTCLTGNLRIVSRIGSNPVRDKPLFP